MTKKIPRGSPFYAESALACLFAALICAGAYISIITPISPVPLTLGNFFAVLGGLLLGPLWGTIASALYIAVGALGFPVFSGGRGGIAHFLGPSGGYLFGYVAGAFFAGLLSKKHTVLSTVVGVAFGFTAILLIGSIGLRINSGIDWAKAIAVGVLPFLPGDAAKAVLAALIALRLGAFMDSLRHGGGANA